LAGKKKQSAELVGDRKYLLSAVYRYVFVRKLRYEYMSCAKVLQIASDNSSINLSDSDVLILFFL
jgi:hypothetical protein